MCVTISLISLFVENKKKITSREKTKKTRVSYGKKPGDGVRHTKQTPTISLMRYRQPHPSRERVLTGVVRIE